MSKSGKIKTDAARAARPHITVGDLAERLGPEVAEQLASHFPPDHRGAEVIKGLTPNEARRALGRRSGAGAYLVIPRHHDPARPDVGDYGLVISLGALAAVVKAAQPARHGQTTLTAMSARLDRLERTVETLGREARGSELLARAIEMFGEKALTQWLLEYTTSLERGAGPDEPAQTSESGSPRITDPTGLPDDKT